MTMNPTDALRQSYFAANPTAAFQNVFGSQLGNNLDTPYSRFVRGLYNTFFNQYQGIAADQPSLTAYDYFKQQQGVPQDMWANFAPSQRGERPSAFSPRVRWNTIFGG